MKRASRKADIPPVPVEFTLQRMANIARDCCVACNGITLTHVHSPRAGIATTLVKYERATSSIAKAIYKFGVSGYAVVLIRDSDSYVWWLPNDELAEERFANEVLILDETKSKSA